jgi:hypothetical protein
MPEYAVCHLQEVVWCNLPAGMISGLHQRGHPEENHGNNRCKYVADVSPHNKIIFARMLEEAPLDLRNFLRNGFLGELVTR